MTHPAEQTVQKGQTLIDFCINYTDNIINTVRTGKNIMHIPKPCKRIDGPIKGHLHHTLDEIFVQVSGSCEMEFPEEVIFLNPGEICIVPKSTPHFETAENSDGPFFNLVICFEQNTLSFHSAVESQKNEGQPSIHKGHRFHSNYVVNACTYIEDMILYYFKNDGDSAVLCEGLALSLFSIFRVILKTQEPDLISEPPKISRCKEIVKNNISNSELNVTAIARRLDCSADYLSFLFRKETGDTLNSYIMRHRIDKAKELVTDSSHQICEVGWYCGFADPSYFIRVFRKQTGFTPKQYRDKMRV